MNAESQRRLHNIASIGTVFAVNPANQQMRLNVGENQTDWLPIPALAAGAVKAWRCPSIGEQFLLVSPSGDLANAIPAISIYSDHHPSPSQNPDQIHVQFNGDSHLTIDTDTGVVMLKAAAVTLDCPVTTMTGNLTVAGNIHAAGDVTAGSISLQSHTHGNVQNGRSITGAPQ